MINSRKIYNEKYKGKLDYMSFKKILDKVNEKIVDRIIEKQEAFNFGHNLGRLMCIEEERRFKQNENGTFITGINWPKSFELKEKLIAEGKVPKEGDNGGVPWFVYNTTAWVMKFLWLPFRRPHREKEGEHYYPIMCINDYRFTPTPALRRRLTKFKFENEHINFRLKAA